mmetsp:Transcript_129892/g.376087  ORF Transcript_129892/g.376087 Transcript_129892/m.376087 type:complete len:403 (-) Transcript_129892:239-1447(-)
MGIDFRGKGYVRRVKIGKRTVKEGEAVAVWDQYGRHKEIVGPARVRLWWSTIRFLDRHLASAEQYLRVQNRDGTVEHRRGPMALFENPVKHTAVSIENAIQLPDSSSFIVVLRREGTKATPEQSVIQGPLLFFPEPKDSVKPFAWAGHKQPGAAAGSAGSTSVGASDGAAPVSGILSAGGCVLSTRATGSLKLSIEARDSADFSATVVVILYLRITSVKDALEVSDPLRESMSLLRSAVLGALANVRFADRGKSLHHIVREALSASALEESLAAALRQRAACEFVRLDTAAVEPSEVLAKLLRREDELADAKVADELAKMSLAASMARQGQEHELASVQQRNLLKLEAEKHSAHRSQEEYEDRRRLENLKQLRSLGVDLTKYLCTVAEIDVADASRKGWVRL